MPSPITFTASTDLSTKVVTHLEAACGLLPRFHHAFHAEACAQFQDTGIKVPALPLASATTCLLKACLHLEAAACSAPSAVSAVSAPVLVLAGPS